MQMRKEQKDMRKVTRRKWLAAAGTAAAAAGANGLLAQEPTPASTHNYNFQKISPR